MRILIILFTLLTPVCHALSSLTANVDRNPAMAGETIVLTISADDNINANKLDTSALLQQFVVGQTQVSRNTQVINGKISRQSRWIIHLIARQPGQYTIPTFNIAGVSSQPISLKVVKTVSSDHSNQKNQEVMLKTQLSANSVYIGQQLVYTLKLYIGTSLQRAQLQTPELANAEITQLGEDADSNEIVNGRRYRVITRRYSIRPNVAGHVELQGSIFRGDIALGKTGFFGNGRSKPMTLVSDNHRLEIKAIPEDFPGPWLVSDMGILEQKWEQPTRFQVGHPITRTLTLTATNVTKEQLPTLDIKHGAILQAYPDKPVSEQMLKGDIIIAQRIQKIAIIPSTAGPMTIPTVRIPWFNSVTEKTEWATIAAMEVNIEPSSEIAQPLAPIPQVVPVVNPVATPTVAPTVMTHSPTLKYWMVACLLLAILSMVLMMLFLRSRQQLQRFKQHQVRVKAVNCHDDYWSSLKLALENKDIAAIIQLLPLWLKQQHNISQRQFEEKEPDLYQVYQELLANRYSSGVRQQQTSLKPLIKCILTLKQQAKLSDKTVNSLYPKN